MAKPSKLSKSAKTDRQRLIEDTLKKQRSSEKRRGNVIIAAAVVVALLILGVAAGPIVYGKFKEDAYADTPVDEVGAAASACREPIEDEGADVGNHIEQPLEATYDTAPPAFGPHWNVGGVAPVTFREKFYGEDDRPPLEALVHNLEHGYTIMWYDEDVAGDTEQMAQIRAIAKKFKESGDNQNFRNKFIAAPWKDSDENDEYAEGKDFPKGTHVAFTHWKASGADASIGIRQYCTEVSGEALVDFMEKYPYTDSPEATIP